MSRTVSVVIPVKDGERWLGEVLAAVGREQPDEVLVIDSGSQDDSTAIARAAGATVLEIAPREFGHGRTRNLGAERTTGELICFLTQDATPLPGWLAAYHEAFDAAPYVGAAYGPHRARPDTSPMIARELEEFFATFSPGGEPVVQEEDGPAFLSNVNAAYLRRCWEEIRFDDVRYSEDQAFGRAMLAAGWRKVYHPGAAVLHAHDYGPLAFMRRYFDEYRGLRETTGHVEGIGVRSTLRDVRSLVAGDRRWMRAQGVDPARRAAWTGRSAVHHGGRKAFAALGSRADRLPPAVQRSISLEGRAIGDGDGGPPPRRPTAAAGPTPFEALLECARAGAAPLEAPVPGMAERDRLHIAVVIPPFRRGSGGHSTIYNVLTRLEARGHTVSTWLHDPTGLMANDGPAVIRGHLREYFRPTAGPVFKGFADWYGADVVLATGWDTVYPVLRLPHCRARAYFVQDHEPEFFATSAQSLWARESYLQGLHVIAASPWLAELARERYGASVTTFDLGVDHDVYRRRPVERRDNTVVFYARDATPRRAVPLGLVALDELARRRPDTRFLLFGDDQPIRTPFAYEHLGIVSPEQLSWAYSEATVGLSLSLTNYSLIPQEMLACGLPVVELAGRSLEGVFGAEGPLELAPPHPVALADALERLLGDPALRERRAAAGLAFVAGRTWDHAADQVEDGLRSALRTAGARTPPPAERLPPAADPATWQENARAVATAAPTGAPATDRLYARLDAADVDAVTAALDTEQRETLATASAADQRRITLAYGVWHRIPAVLEKAGLLPDEPPADVHAMARGPLAAGGALGYADLLAATLERVGAPLDGARRALDFGCSSGRVVRALAATWPDVEWHGCDPNTDAIAWAHAHLPGVRFLHAPQDPPLPYDDGVMDVVLAISIWSHYAAPAALRWLDEMARVVRPGGHLVLTTHGFQSVAHDARAGWRSAAQLADVRRELYRSGYWFAPEFGAGGDWGVKHPEWGTAFTSPEWMARHVTPAWSIADYAVGGNAGNQDVYALRRSSGRP